MCVKDLVVSTYLTCFAPSLSGFALQAGAATRGLEGTQSVIERHWSMFEKSKEKKGMFIWERCMFKSFHECIFWGGGCDFICLICSGGGLASNGRRFLWERLFYIPLLLKHRNGEGSPRKFVGSHRETLPLSLFSLFETLWNQHSKNTVPKTAENTGGY